MTRESSSWTDWKKPFSQGARSSSRSTKKRVAASRSDTPMIMWCRAVGPTGLQVSGVHARSRGDGGQRVREPPVDEGPVGESPHEWGDEDGAGMVGAGTRSGAERAARGATPGSRPGRVPDSLVA